MAHQTLVRVRILDDLVELHAAHDVTGFLRHVGAVEDRAEQATVDRRLVENERIFLIVARVAADSNTDILSARQFSILNVLLKVSNDIE